MQSMKVEEKTYELFTFTAILSFESDLQVIWIDSGDTF